MASKFSFDVDLSQVLFSDGGYNKLLNEPDGEVGRYLERRGRLIVIAAKRQVGVKSSRLRESIRMTRHKSIRGQYVRIGSRNRVSLIHHEGTRPHAILPDRHKALRFSNSGRMVYARSVMHPGTKPNRYLSDNLRLVRV